jgi:hypothetical protein
LPLANKIRKLADRASKKDINMNMNTAFQIFVILIVVALFITLIYAATRKTKIKTVSPFRLQAWPSALPRTLTEPVNLSKNVELVGAEKMPDTL